MKKSFFIILFAFLAFNLISQERTTYSNTLDTMAILGEDATNTVTLPALVEQWDISIMLQGAIQGIGDSATATVDVYQSNAYIGEVWTEILTDTTNVNGSWLWETLDFNGLRLKLIVTGACLDTAIFTPYIVYKRKAGEL